MKICFVPFVCIQMTSFIDLSNAFVISKNSIRICILSIYNDASNQILFILSSFECCLQAGLCHQQRNQGRDSLSQVKLRRDPKTGSSISGKSKAGFYIVQVKLGRNPLSGKSDPEFYIVQVKLRRNPLSGKSNPGFYIVQVNKRRDSISYR